MWRKALAALALLVVLIAAGFLGVDLLRSSGASQGRDAQRLLEKRLAMVRGQIAARGVRDRRVLAAMRAVPRHALVSPADVDEAYEDRPLPIGFGQTISQPFIVALMTELAAVRSGDKVLEIGTGSGYQAAVLAELTERVDSVEIIPELARRAAERLGRLGFGRVAVKNGDGYFGWAARAPTTRLS